MISRIFKITALFFLFFIIVVICAYVTLTLIIKSENTVVVPDLVGKDVVYALEILTDLGLNTKVKGFEYSSKISKNYIISQEPEPGAEIKTGRNIRIIISKGFEIILMPNLKGISVQQANIILEENGLCSKNISFAYSTSIKKNRIIAQTPSPSSSIRRNKCVNLLVSVGLRPKAYKMHNLTGLSLDNAILLIESDGLMLGTIKASFDKDKPLNIISGQEPLSGYRVIEGSTVNLFINKKPGVVGKNCLQNSKGIALFRYRLEQGFLKKLIRVRLNCFGVSSDLFNDLMKPGKELWLLIPKNQNATVLPYENDELVKTQIFE